MAGPALGLGLALSSSPSAGMAQAGPAVEVQEFPVPRNARPHDVAPAADGGVWYTAQGSGELGWLDPATGETRHMRWATGRRPTA